MKDHKFGMGYGLKVNYRGITDSLFCDEPYEDEFDIEVNDFSHLSYLLSEEGIRETCEKENFDLSQKIKVAIIFRTSTDGNDLIITIQDTSRSPRVTYQSTHVIDDENINQKIDSVYQSLFRNLKESASRDGVKI